MIDNQGFVSPWAKISSRVGDSWHSMCSYLGSFPAPLANYFIRYFTSEGDLVYDPFSGRGTTLLEARILKRNSIASDLNPIALALSEAKNQNIELSDVLERIDFLNNKYDSALFMPEAMAQPDDIHLIFHPRTLAQLCYLKRKLLKSDSQIDKFLIGCVLGILHGGERKNGTSGYASISMPNTFSMSPEYVRRFVQTKQLNREFRDVFTILKDKAKRLFDKHSHLSHTGNVFKADAKNIGNNDCLEEFKGKVDLILTSPPYLGIVNYAKQNWIRSWFLDKNPLEVSENLDDDLNLEEWIKFSKQVISQLKLFLKPDGVAVFVIGDVAKSKTSIVPLAREFCLMIKENNLFNNVWCFADNIEDQDKTTRIWGDTKGNATATDRIVILSDGIPFGRNNRLDEGLVPLEFSHIVNSTNYFLKS